jgi:prolyl oligopeptidase
MTLAAIAAALSLSQVAIAADGPPVAPVRPVTDDYFGTKVVDNYRYMENLQDPEVKGWMKAQADYSRKVFDSIPGRDALGQRIHELLGKDLIRFDYQRRGERIFYQVQEPGADIPKLAYRDGVAGDEHVLIDPALLAKAAGTHYSLDWYSPSADGRYVAYGVSEGGSEKSVLHVKDLKTGETLSENIDRTEDCIVSWRDDNHSFFYLRYNKPGPDTPPAETLSNARTYLHVLGSKLDGEGDELVFGRGVSKSLDVPEGQGTYVLLSPGSRYAIAVANHNMDDNPATFYIAPLAAIHGPGTPWKKFATVDDGVTAVRIHGDRLYFLSEKDAPHFRLLSTPLSHPDVAHAQVVLPEGEGVLVQMASASDGLYVSQRSGAGFKMMRVSFDGKDVHPLNLPFAGTVGRIATDPTVSGAMFSMQGWVRAPAEMRYDASSDRIEDTGLIPPSKVDVSAAEATETFATSYDGTRVPLSIVARKGVTLDGSHPTILIGYGSYGISLDPFFDPAFQAWLEHGGIVAVAHLRGGGEYGDAWHRGGQKLTKLNTVLDFIACAQSLVDKGYTSPGKLAGNGGSAGGITAGGALTMRPDLFAVILDDVGMSDTLRTELEPNGPPNVPEFGSTSTEAGFHGLYAMSAYAHVHDGTAYPAVVFTTGANDPRVASWHMMKMAARVQAATSSKRPVLLRIDYDAGHGIGSSLSQYEQELADEWAFTLWQTGDPAFQPKS